MKRLRCFRRAALLCSIAGFTSLTVMAQTGDAQAGDGQKLPWQIGSSGLVGKQNNAVVFFSPEQTTIAANKPVVIDLHFRIAEGLHINSHKPHDGTLIPAQIVVADTTGLETTAVDFPAGTDASFAFAPDQKLSVYQGELVLRAHIIAKPGHHLWQGSMRYQACDQSECLPPKRVPVAVDVIAQ